MSAAAQKYQDEEKARERSTYFVQLSLQDVMSILGLLQLLCEFGFHLSALLVQCLEGALLTAQLLKSKRHTRHTADGSQADTRVTDTP